MSLMISGVVDSDGQSIVASCPIYTKNPKCVNSCALFVPFQKEDGTFDFSCGQCGLGNGMTQLMFAMDSQTEATWRMKEGYE